MNLEQRVDRLELFGEEVKQRLARIEARLDVIEAQLSHMATKADLAGLEARLIKWLISTALAMTTVMGGVVVAVVRLMH